MITEREIRKLIKEQKEYIKELIDTDKYTLYDFLDVTKCDKMAAYTTNPENYNFELGKYIAYKDILNL